MRITKITTRRSFKTFTAICLLNEIYEPFGSAKHAFRAWLIGNPYRYNPIQAAYVTINRQIIGWAIDVQANNNTETWAYVKPEHRRKGYGAQLINKLNGAKQVHFWCAKDFWEKVGYQEIV